jgi:NADH:ubiquinone oxidoreductase subunit 4 (subunit M)
VFLGPVNEKYKDLEDINARELFCQAPLLALCVVLGILPWYLLDWMRPSVQHLVDQLSATGGV